MHGSAHDRECAGRYEGWYEGWYKGGGVRSRAHSLLPPSPPTLSLLQPSLSRSLAGAPGLTCTIARMIHSPAALNMMIETSRWLVSDVATSVADQMPAPP